MLIMQLTIKTKIQMCRLCSFRLKSKWSHSNVSIYNAGFVSVGIRGSELVSILQISTNIWQFSIYPSSFNNIAICIGVFGFLNGYLLIFGRLDFIIVCMLQEYFVCVYFKLVSQLLIGVLDQIWINYLDFVLLSLYSKSFCIYVDNIAEKMSWTNAYSITRICP